MAASLLGASGCSYLNRGPSEREQKQERADQAVRVGASLAEEGRLQEALQQFALAIEQNPTLTTAHLGMGEIYEVNEDYQAAEVAYRRAAEVEPANFTAQYKHGLMLQVLDRVSEAIRAYLRALAIRPGDFGANLNLATAYLELNEPRQSLTYARRAVELDPRSGPARMNLGAVYARLGRHNDAVREYQAAAELMDLTPKLLLNLADSLGKAGRHQEMVNTLSQLNRIDPSAQSWERTGYAYFQLRRYSRAIEAFRKAIEADPRHYPALNGVGVCLLNRYLSSDRQDTAALREAIETMRRSLRINRDQPRIVELISRYGR